MCHLDKWMQQQPQTHLAPHRWDKLQEWTHWTVVFLERLIPRSVRLTMLENNRFCHRKTPSRKQNFMWIHLAFNSSSEYVVQLVAFLHGSDLMLPKFGLLHRKTTSRKQNFMWIHLAFNCEFWICYSTYSVSTWIWFKVTKVCVGTV